MTGRCADFFYVGLDVNFVDTHPLLIVCVPLHLFLNQRV